jgi:hypothetical protein
VYRNQPIPVLALARAMAASGAGPAGVLQVYLGGGGLHERTRQELAKQPLRDSMVLVVDDVDLPSGLAGPELAETAARIADYYGMVLSLRGRWAEALAADAVSSPRLIWVDRDARISPEPGVGALWMLPRSRVAAWEALRGALATAADPHQASWSNLVRFADRVDEIRHRYGMTMERAVDLEYWVGAAVALRGLPADVDVAALSRQVLPLTKDQAAAIAGGGKWASGHADLPGALLAGDSVAVVRYGSGGMRPVRRALVGSGIDKRPGVQWIELDGGRDKRATSLNLRSDTDWRVRVLRSPDTEVWFGPPRTFDAAPGGADLSDADATRFTPSVAADGELEPLNAEDFVRPRQSRAERWVLYDRMLKAALLNRLTGAQVRELTAGIEGEVIGRVDFGADNAKMFAGIALLLETGPGGLAALTQGARFQTLLTSLSGCDVGPAEKLYWIDHMRAFRQAALQLRRLSVAHTRALDQMTNTWVNCGGDP